MTFTKYSELLKLTTINEINEELFLLNKNLLELRIKRAINQTVKPHLFKHLKRRIAQLQFRKSTLIKSMN